MMIVIQVQPAVIVLLLEDKSTMAMHVGRGRGRDKLRNGSLFCSSERPTGLGGCHITLSQKNRIDSGTLPFRNISL